MKLLSEAEAFKIGTGTYFKGLSHIKFISVTYQQVMKAILTCVPSKI